MTRKSGDRPLDELERRFQALRDQVGALPEAGRPGLETALQEVSQAIAALRAAGEAGESPARSGRARPRAAADAILRHVFNAIPDLITVIDRDFNIITSNWHDHEHVPEEERRGRPKCYRVYVHRDRPCEPCQVLEVFATGKPQKIEWLSPMDGRDRGNPRFPRHR